MEIAQITTILFTVLYLLESLANIKLRRENKTLRKTIQILRAEKVRLKNEFDNTGLKQW